MLFFSWANVGLLHALFPATGLVLYREQWIINNYVVQILD